MTLTVDIEKAKRMALKGLLAGLVPMLWGPPAIGKSAITHQIAKENDLLVIDERLSDCDPTDLKGYPSVNQTTGKGFYRPMETFPLEGDPLPVKTPQYNVGDKLPDGTKATKIIPATHYSGWLLFLDEITNADDDVKKAAYKLILDRKVGQKNLHPNVAIICAGNDISHGAMASELGTAMQSRLMHADIEINFKVWMAWAIDHDIDQRIRDYLNFTRGEKLYTFKPDHTDKTFASPRTWEFADKYIKAHGFEDEDIYAALAGMISPGVAAEFMQFCTVYKDLPKIETILQGPDWTPIPDGLSSIFALCGNIAAAMNLQTVDKLMVYIKRLPPEFIIVTMIDAMKRDATLKQNSHVRSWAMQNGHELF
jgi:hypothetical protein